ncbi:hypothetical protein ANN_16045 [Periplaneta americana]|uniref:Uncharacterized protein n=1 Tax=Periplaneta americana TaxID=6978 RepID=A0ABQ8SHW0_PERAM|nr:hypothetical protein ANN_16045 [Periplaneta americana]
MAGLCEGGNEPPGSLKAIWKLKNFSNHLGQWYITPLSRANDEPVVTQTKHRKWNGLAIHSKEKGIKKANKMKGTKTNILLKSAGSERGKQNGDYLTSALRLGKMSGKTKPGNQPKRESNSRPSAALDKRVYSLIHAGGW